MERLKKLRAINKINQQNLADIIGVSRSTVAMWETNSSQPDYDTLKKIADFFNVSVDYLLGRTDDPSPPKSPKYWALAKGGGGAQIPQSALYDLSEANRAYEKAEQRDKLKLEIINFIKQHNISIDNLENYKIIIKALYEKQPQERD